MSTAEQQQNGQSHRSDTMSQAYRGVDALGTACMFPMPLRDARSNCFGVPEVRRRTA